MAQLGARLDGIEEVEGSNPFGSTSLRPRKRRRLPRRSRMAKAGYPCASYGSASQGQRCCMTYVYILQSTKDPQHFYVGVTDEKQAFAFEKYLKSASGRAFARKRL